MDNIGWCDCKLNPILAWTPYVKTYRLLSVISVDIHGYAKMKRNEIENQDGIRGSQRASKGLLYSSYSLCTTRHSRGLI